MGAEQILGKITMFRHEYIRRCRVAPTEMFLSFDDWHLCMTYFNNTDSFVSFCANQTATHTSFMYMGIKVMWSYGVDNADIKAVRNEP